MAAKKQATDRGATIRRDRGRAAAGHRPAPDRFPHEADAADAEPAQEPAHPTHPAHPEYPEHPEHPERPERGRVRALKAEAAQRTADVANRVDLLAHVLDDRERAVRHHRLTAARTYATLGADGLTRMAAAVLAGLCRYPAAVPDPVLAGYAAPSRELRLRIELPRLSAIPVAVGHRYLPSRGEIVADPRRPEEIRTLYRDLTARFTLLALDHAFGVTPPDLVDAVVLDGRVRATDLVGEPVHPCLVSLRVARDVFEALDLDLDPVRGDPAGRLVSLGARLSRHPYDLEPVEPLLPPDLGRA